MIYFPSDLENFRTHQRNAVSVREGQGVVLLCGPPPHSGGQYLNFNFFRFFIQTHQLPALPQMWLLAAQVGDTTIADV